MGPMEIFGNEQPCLFQAFFLTEYPEGVSVICPKDTDPLKIVVQLISGKQMFVKVCFATPKLQYGPSANSDISFLRAGHPPLSTT